MTAGHQRCARLESRLQAINTSLEDVMATDSAQTFLACGGMFLRVFHDLGVLVRRAVARNERPPLEK